MKAVSPKPSLRDLLEANGWPGTFVGQVLVFALVSNLTFTAMVIQAGFSALATPLVDIAQWSACMLAATLFFSRKFAARLPAALACAFVAVSGGLLSTTIGLLGLTWMNWNIPGGVWRTLLLAFLHGEFIITGLAAIAWYYFARGSWDATQLRETEAASARLASGLVEARLLSLQAQVEPHFLFNTLAHVKWMYARQPEQGRRMLDRLLDYLQTALPQMRDSRATLRQEVELARAYLDIQGLRLGTRLAYDIEVDPAALDKVFPPMMLSTLVENAIRHGIGPLPEGGLVRIVGTMARGELRVEVLDTGAGLRESLGKGVGIANVRARLQASFGAAGKLLIGPNHPRGVVAAILVPT